MEGRPLEIYNLGSVGPQNPKEALVDDIYQLVEHPIKSDIQS